VKYTLVPGLFEAQIEPHFTLKLPNQDGKEYYSASAWGNGTHAKPVFIGQRRLNCMSVKRRSLHLQGNDAACFSGQKVCSLTGAIAIKWSRDFPARRIR